jgi:hypothetical protein
MVIHVIEEVLAGELAGKTIFESIHQPTAET